MTATCNNCGKPPKGVTLGPESEGWTCPYCGAYNDFVGSKARENNEGEGA